VGVGIAVLILVSIAQAQENSCDFVPPAKLKKVVYCESLPIGTTANNALAISLESKFFARLKRSRSGGSVRFERDGRSVFDYPDSFVVAVEKIGLLNAAAPTSETPQNVTIRWFDASHTLLREVSSALEEVHESWREQAPTKIWYRAIINGVSPPLGSEIEITLFSNSESLGTVRRFL
jgi:hypothetical protein